MNFDLKSYVYFDWADLQNAFSGSLIACPNAESRELNDIISKVAQDGRLVLSQAHLFDLGRSVDTKKEFLAGSITSAKEISIWLDGLNPKWLKFEIQNLLDEEVYSFILRKIQKRDFHPVSVTGSFLSIFSKWSQKSFSNALKDPTIKGFTSEMLGDPEGIQLFLNLGHVSQESFVKMAIDRQIVRRRNAFKELKSSISEKFRDALLLGINNGFNRLSIEHRDIYLKICERSDLFSLTKQLYLEEIMQNPSNIPYTFLAQEMINHFSDKSGESVIQSNKFRKKFRSAYTDHAHIIGATYCGVFTCDGEVSNSIKNYRALWGLNPQLSKKHLGKKYIPSLIKQLGY